jgi:hypothetical protein
VILIWQQSKIDNRQKVILIWQQTLKLTTDKKWYPYMTRPWNWQWTKSDTHIWQDLEIDKEQKWYAYLTRPWNWQWTKSDTAWDPYIVRDFVERFVLGILFREDFCYFFLWASVKPTCSCHIFYTNRRFPVCGYCHLMEKIWDCQGW